MKVSVIMPVYNTEKYLKEAIESILNQSFKDFEFIIIDDCSSDNSYKICEEFAQKDSRIQLYKNEKNMWISVTRNKLIEKSQTNYIASQDSDDISEWNRLELCFYFLEKNKNYWVVSWDNIIINEEWKKIWFRKYSNNIQKIILKKSPISQWSSIFRKDIYLKVWCYDSKLNYGEDYDLWLKMYSQWFLIHNLDSPLYQVRIREWQSKSEALKQTIKNTIFIQKRAIKKYNIRSTTSDNIYHLLERILLILPTSFIMWLFIKLEYKKS